MKNELFNNTRENKMLSPHCMKFGQHSSWLKFILNQYLNVAVANMLPSHPSHTKVLCWHSRIKESLPILSLRSNFQKKDLSRIQDPYNLMALPSILHIEN